MKHLLIILLISGLITVSFGQQPRLVYVEEGEGTLNIAIDGDTLAGGVRNDPDNTWYVLKNNGWYITIGTIQVVAPLRIVTEDYAPGGPKDKNPDQYYSPASPGNRAHLAPGLNAAGSAGIIFQYQGDLTLKGLHIWGRIALGFDQPTSLIKNTIRSGAPGLNLSIIDCFCERDAQSFFRLDKENLVCTFLNSTFRNMGQIADPSNSRVIDTRGNNGQTMKFVNCTFLNGSKHVLLSGFGAGGVNEEYTFNHCSFINNGYSVHFGRIKKAELKNSLLINNGWHGMQVGFANADIGDGFALMEAILDADSLIIENVLQPQDIDIHHNNIWLDRVSIDTILTRIYADCTGTGHERLSLPYFTPLAEAGAHDNLAEPLQFTAGPMLPIDYCRNFNMAEWARLIGAGSSAGNYFNAANGEFVVDTTGQNSYDLSYSTAAFSYTAGSDGLPLGDLRWFPDKFGAFVTSISEVDRNLPNSFVVLQNYPNPFNPNTHIVYTLPVFAKVNLRIFNMLGQEVRKLIDNKTMEAGKHSIQWDGRNDAGFVMPNGIYICQFEAGKISRTHKLLMIK